MHTRQERSDLSAALSRLYDGQPAERVVRSLAFDLFAGSKMKGPPFSPFEYAKLLGVGVEYAPLAAEGVFVHDGGAPPKVILPPPHLDEMESARRRRNFTLGHELGHYVIRRALWGRVPKSAFLAEDSGEEGLCDSFAEELLMPSSVMLKDVRTGTDPTSLLQLSDRYDVSLTSLLCRTKNLCQGHLSAIIWSTNGGHYLTHWTTPRCLHGAVLCDTGETSVEKVLSHGGQQESMDHILVSGQRMRWHARSMLLWQSNRVLSVLTKTSREARTFLHAPERPLKPRDPKVPIQQVLPFSGPPFILASRRRKASRVQKSVLA
jgi:IrrE N-terminal-like domain